MKYNLLAVERLREVFRYDAETGHLTRLVGGPCDGSPWGTYDAYGYLVGTVDKKYLKAHQIAWAIHYGEWANSLIDHINGRRDDNRICNLRKSDKRQNAQNMKSARSDNKQGLLGVTRKYRRYRATIFANGKQNLVGSFATPEEAHEAYLRAKAVLHRGYVA